MGLSLEQQAMVVSVLCLADQEARRVKLPRGCVREDFHAVACLGLCLGALRYDAAKGPWEPFARMWARQEIIRQLPHMAWRVGKLGSPGRQILSTSSEAWIDDDPLARLIEAEDLERLRIAVDGLKGTERRAIHGGLAGLKRTECGDTPRAGKCAHHHGLKRLRAAMG